MPLYVSITIIPLTSGFSGAAASAFAALALAIAMLIVVTRLLVATARQQVVEVLQHAAIRIKKASGVVLIDAVSGREPVRHVRTHQPIDADCASYADRDPAERARSLFGSTPPPTSGRDTRATTVVVRGVGDVGSAIAHHPVEGSISDPSSSPRPMSLVPAVSKWHE